MRLITADECGLIKECIPDNAVSDPAQRDGENNVWFKPGQVPVISTAEDEMACVRRICHDPLVDGIPSRRRGVVGLAWMTLPGASGDDDDDGAANSSVPPFASLRVDGTVQLWQTSSIPGSEGDAKKNKNKKTRKQPLSFGNFRRVRQSSDIFAPVDSSSDSAAEAASEQQITSESLSSNNNNDKPLPERKVRLQTSSVSPLNRPLNCFGLGACRPGYLVAGNSKGDVVVVNAFSDQGETGSSMSIVSRFSMFPNANEKTTQNVYVPYKGQREYPRITTMGVDLQNKFVAMGGQEQDVMLYDLETEKQVWKAKNLPPDPQTLLAPQVWPSALLFLNQQQTYELPLGYTGLNGFSGKVGHHKLLAVGSAHGQVRIYDVRETSIQQQRRPVLYTPENWLEYRVTSLCQTNATNDNRLVIGDSAGFLIAMDLRKFVPGGSSKGKKYTRLAKSNVVDYVAFRETPAGSIRALTQHSTLPRMAAVGMDRMLRIYDTKKRLQVSCMYLKQRLNCVLVSPEMGKKSSSAWDDDDDEDDHADEDGKYEDDQDIEQDDVVEDYHSSGDSDSNEDDSNEDDEIRVNESIDEIQNDDDDNSSQEGDDDDDSSSASNGEGDNGDGTSDEESSEHDGESKPRKRRKH